MKIKILVSKIFSTINYLKLVQFKQNIENIGEIISFGRMIKILSCEEHPPDTFGAFFRITPYICKIRTLYMDFLMEFHMFSYNNSKDAIIIESVFS